MGAAANQLMKNGVFVPEILLPSPGTDYGSWAVVACDQYSSEREYWDRVAANVKGKPSTLNMIFPECYLQDDDKKQRIGRIQESMREYLDKGILQPRGPGFILVERTTPYEASPRIGLVIAVDLEQYRYSADSKSLIRPTEGTIVERLPPRMEIRRGAALELPHVMLLLNDPANTVIEPIYEKRAFLAKAYDFDLMENSGHIRGWLVQGEGDMAQIAQAISGLADPDAFRKKYGSDDVLLFAVGDGNHSLATAKAIWEETKAQLEGNPDRDAIIRNHPSRYALAELVNIYNSGLPFHPIHRVLFNVDERALFAEMEKAGAKISRMENPSAAFEACDASASADCHAVAFAGRNGCGLIEFTRHTAKLAAGTVQGILDAYLKKHPETGIDYIHGEGSLLSLGTKPGNIGLYLPPVDKASFFPTVIRDGVMPRKTFSMGEAPEKRFYIESRRINL